MTNINKQISTESDSLNERAEPVNAYYGIQTVRAIENFPITGYCIEEVLFKAMGDVKKSRALANKKLVN